MPKIYCITISIYDTSVPATVLGIPLDYAQRGSCILTYEGSDDKLQALYASTLSFSLEVDHIKPGVTPETSDLFYSSLFTGDEKRYKVEVTDQAFNILWEGFLLPDEYSEPYTAGTFWPKFKATDGLGILKGVILEASFYRARQSKAKILADCLKETGLEYEIYVRPSLTNAGAGDRIDKLYLNASGWISGDRKINAYEILEAVVQGLGCTLWQERGRWYVAGYASKGDEGVTYQKYDKDGLYIADVTVNPSVSLQNTLDWNTAPQVTLKPPFKAVTIKTSLDKIKELLPETIAAQPWTKTLISHNTFSNAPPTKYWIGSQFNYQPILTYRAGGIDAPPFVADPVEIVELVSAYIVYTNANNTQQMDNYLSLARPVYVKGGNGQKISFKLTLLTSWFTGLGLPTLDNSNYIYDVRLNNATIFSNKLGFGPREAFFFSFKNVGGNEVIGHITGEVEVLNFILPTSGFLDIRIHHLKTDYAIQALAIERLQLEYTDEASNEFSRVRDLNRTNKREVSLDFGDSALDAHKLAIVYQEPYAPADVTEIPFTFLNNWTSQGRFYGNVLNFNLTEYNLFVANLAKIYIKKQNSDYYHFIEDYTLIGLTGNVRLIQVNFHNDFELEDGDKIYFHNTISLDPQTGTLHLQRELWDKNGNTTFTNRYGYVLAEVIHDVYPAPLVVFEGLTKEIFFPSDIKHFVFNLERKKWIPTRLELIFGENESKITAMEFKNEKVTDFIL